MSSLWLIAAFLAGWFACWKSMSFILVTVLRRGNKLMVDSISGLSQDALLKVSAAVDAELAKRRENTA